MELNPACRFLALPQEIRDLVYAFALEEELAPPKDFREFDHASMGISVAGTDTNRPPFIINYPAHPPLPPWYTLLFVCDRVMQEVRSYFISRAIDEPAVLRCELTATSATMFFTRLPSPSPPRTLRIELRILHLFEASLQAGAIDNRALFASFHGLKRYLTHGSHLARASSLADEGQLDALKLSLAPMLDYEAAAQFYYGEPRMQLRVVIEALKGWMSGLCRCGVLHGKVRRVMIEGENFECPVEDTVFDENEAVRYNGLGYFWNDVNRL